MPEGALSIVSGGGREELADLATQTGLVDLIVPRGGEGLKAALKGVATVPVIYAASGNCHVYVDAGADLDSARAIVLNAKLQRPGVCNAAETLLVHADVATSFLPDVLGSLHEAGVVLHADARARAAAPDVPASVTVIDPQAASTRPSGNDALTSARASVIRGRVLPAAAGARRTRAATPRPPPRARRGTPRPGGSAANPRSG